MTLEEAIKAEEAETLAYEECLNSLDDNMPTDMWNELNKSLGKQMDYHRQLAEWLRELQRYKFEISECKAILDNPTPDVTENDRKRAMYVLQTFPDVRGEQYEN